MVYLDEALLDDEDHLRACDRRGTVRALATAGAQVREGLALSADADMARLARGDRPRSVLVASLGGSAVVADVLDMLAEPGSPVPVSVRRNVPLPGWVGPLDLVVAVSLSGRARGPLAVAAEAARRGASLLTVGASDSPLAAVCARARGVHVDVGRDRVSSRTSLWSLLTPVLVGADALGLVDVPESTLLGAADRLDAEADACRPSSESFVNPAKLLALGLAGTVPVVLGDGALSGVAAARAAAMLARTARVPATHGELPDAASQIVATFDGPFTAGGGEGVDTKHDIFADPFLDGPSMPRLSMLMVRDAPAEITTPEEADLAALTDAVLATAEDTGVRVSTVVAEPGPPVVRLAGQIARIDFAATYLAIGSGLDPAESRHLHQLRDRFN
ncbi:SIS domain-containing protein [Mobilicoccus massiliensis]|uniref:SIS domain-containing protein n=1 Tax=Mobilicoccus massiliensis TaxID=1522310 RepID=UPI00058D3CC2|nr:SIS domain-containing protein [Mobilicoccus massiliensis]